MSAPGQYDPATLKRDHSVSSVVGKYVELKPDGDEFRALCPFHKENTPSFTVVDHKGYAHCFGCGWHGDIIAFLQNKLGVSFTEACEILGGTRVAPAPIAAAGELRESKSLYAGLHPVKASAGDLPLPFKEFRCFNPKRAAEPRGGWTSYLPSAVYPYYDADFAITGIVLRIDVDGGQRKLTPQLQLVALPGSGEIVWCHRPFDRPQPLYGLELLRSTTDEILWVEGEKCADAARAIGYTAVAFPGGGKNIRHADFTPLKDRALLVWGDADDEGEATMLEVCALAQDAGAGPIRFLLRDKARPKGWDIADAIQIDQWPADRIEAYIAERAHVYLSQAERQAEEAARRASEPPSDNVVRPFTVIDGGKSQPPQGDEELATPPFRILGHDRGTFYYMPAGTQQIVELSPTAHTVNSLLNIAPLNYWEQIHPHKTRRFDLSDATDALMRRAESVGIFDVNRLRGRGAWIDKGLPVVHMGDRVLAAGRLYRPAMTPSHFLYQAGRPLEIDHDVTPADTKTAHGLVDICNMVEWQTPLSGELLAGWLITAPICGALHWRPHIWVTGPTQTFKTTIRDRIMKPVLGAIGVFRDGSTTEAHLRQTLYHDALPVVLDETEAEDKAAAIRVKAMMTLARVASSGGSIGKGGTDGKPTDYEIRTMIGFISINPSVTENADESRISKLVTKKYEGDDLDQHFATIEEAIATTITPAFGAALFARTIANLPTLLANIAVFTRAARAALRDGRAADQIGTLLGGLYLCHSTGPVAYQTALEFIQARQWGDHTAINATNDEFRLLRAIMTSVRKLPVAHGTMDRSIGELILAEDMPQAHIDLDRTAIRAELGRLGIKVLDEGLFCIANKSPAISRILDNTPWAADWRRGLRALPGAEAGETTYFSPGFNERCTKLPLTLLTYGNGLKLFP